MEESPAAAATVDTTRVPLAETAADPALTDAIVGLIGEVIPRANRLAELGLKAGVVGLEFQCSQAVSVAIRVTALTAG